MVATDADLPGDTLTYTEVAGGDGVDIFDIDPVTGEITVTDSDALDWELLATSVSYDIEVSDGVFTEQTTVTIDLTPVNDNAPVFDAVGPVAIDENTPVATSVVTVSATDADIVPADMLVFSEVPGGLGEDTFSIAAGEPGEALITVQDNAALDYETLFPTPSISYEIQVSDGVNVTPLTVVIDINPLNDIAPEFVASGPFEVAENAAAGSDVIGTVTATDLDIDTPATFTFSETGGPGAGTFAIDATTGEITIENSDALNREEAASLAYEIEVSDGDPVNPLTTNVTVTINLTGVDDEDPEFGTIDPLSVPEDAAISDVVGTVTATDADVDPASDLTYTETGGTGIGLFAIDPATGEITVEDNVTFDRETVASYIYQIQVTDSVNAPDTAEITINLSDVNDNAPVITTTEPFTVSEDASNGTSVGTATASDEDSSSVPTFSEVPGGASESIFGIAPDGSITVQDAAQFDFETEPSLSYDIQVTDGLFTAPATVTINLTDANDAPALTSVASFEIDEGATGDVATITAEDADEDPLTFSEVPGGLGSTVFDIDASGLITVQDPEELDREDIEIIQYEAQVSDGEGDPVVVTITFLLNGVNDNAPAFDATGPFAIDENLPAGESVGTVTASDADIDPADTLMFGEASGGAGESTFDINPVTGEITVEDNAALDSESAESLLYEITVFDGVTTVTETVTIDLNGLNDNAPVADPVVDSTAEDTPIVITLSGFDLDVDPSQGLTFAVATPPSSGSLSAITQLTATTASVTYTPGADLNGLDSFTYVANDGLSDSAPATVDITVNPVNDAPFANSQTVPTAEDTPLLILLEGTDLEPSALIFEITSGPSNGSLSAITHLTDTTASVTYTPGLDYKGIDTFTFTVSDGDLTSVAATVTIDVASENDAPEFTFTGPFTISESAPADSPVGTVSASDSDVDPVDTLTYSEVGGGAGVAEFAIDLTTGEITVEDSAALDRELSESVSYDIQVTDGTVFVTTTVTIMLEGANDNSPVFTESGPFAVDENSDVGASVGTVSATDADVDPADTLTFSEVGGGAGESTFSIDPATGEITVEDNAALDRELAASVTYDIQVSDDENTATVTVEVTINGLNDVTPAFTGSGPFTVEENSEAGTSVGTVTATDGDVAPVSVLTYTEATGGAGETVFNIDPVTGEITVEDSAAIDNDISPSVLYDIEVSDGANTAAVTVTVNISGLNDNAPEFTATGPFTIEENAAAGAPAGAVAAGDIDGDGLTYGEVLGGAGEAAFAIDPATGEITVEDGAALDRETTASVTYDIVVSDGVFETFATVTIELDGENDNAPLFTFTGPFEIPEESGEGTAVGTVSATDADVDPAETLEFFETEGGAGQGDFSIDETTGEITVQLGAVLDRETTPFVEYEITVRDGEVDTQATVRIDLSDINDNAFVFTETGPYTVKENSPSGSLEILEAVATVESSSDDAHDAPGTFFPGYNSGGPVFAGSPGGDAVPTYGGWRWTDIGIPEGATITGAYVELTQQGSGFPVTSTLRVEDSESPASFSELDPPSGRTTLGPDFDVTWAWLPSTSESLHETPDLSAALQELVDRYGGLDQLVLIEDGTGTPAGEWHSWVSFDGDPTLSALLRIEYRVGTLAGTAVASDPDVDDTLTYSEVPGGVGSDLFDIDPVTGEISLSVGGTLDRESQSEVAYEIEVSDGFNVAQATVTVEIAGLNDNVPVADSGSTTTDEDTSVVITLSGSDLDVDPSQGLTFAVATAPSSGTLSAVTQLTATTAEVTYTPDPDFNGLDSFTYVANDGLSDSAPVTVSLTITSVEDAPVAIGQDVATDEDVPLIITLEGFDADGDALTFSIADGPPNGSLSAITPLTDTTASVTYTPTLDYKGLDSFTFTVSDGALSSAPGTVTIDVASENDAPEFTSTGPFAINENAPIGSSVGTVSATDADGDDLTYGEVTGGFGQAVFDINPATGAITVQDDAALDRELFETTLYSIAVFDGSATTTIVVTVNLDGLNDNSPEFVFTGPFAINENALGGTPVGTVVAVDDDVDPDEPLTYDETTGGAGETLFEIDPVTGAVTVQAGAITDREAGASLLYEIVVSDGENETFATVTVDLDGVNDNTPTGISQSVTTDEDQPVVITVTGIDADIDPPSAFGFIVDAGPASGALSDFMQTGPTTAQITYTPGPDFNGSDSFTFLVDDGGSVSVPATVEITINPVPDLPVAIAQAVSTGEDEQITITLEGFDADGDALTFEIATAPANGSLLPVTQLTPTTARVIYTPDLDYKGADTFTFTVSDGSSGTSSPNAVSVSVASENDAPFFTFSGPFVIDENPVADTPVGTVTADDVDGDELTFGEVPGGAGETVFAIDPVTGAITVEDGSSLDREALASAPYEIAVSDGLLQTVVTVTVELDGVNDNIPAFTFTGPFEIEEDAVEGDVVGTVSASDADVDDAELLAFFEVDGGLGQGHFTINEQTGQIRVQLGATLDRETTPFVEYEITVTDGENETVATVRINLIDVNDNPPAFTQTGPYTVKENSPPGSLDILEAVVSVGASADDAYDAPGTFFPGYQVTDAQVLAGSSGGETPTYGGWRWTDIGIPYGATITRAYVELTQVATGSALTTTLRVENSAFPATFGEGTPPSSRSTLGPAFDVSWPWAPSTPGTIHETPDLTGALQELVDRYGGLDQLVLIEDGTGTPAGEWHGWWSFDGDSTLAAELHIEYRIGTLVGTAVAGDPDADDTLTYSEVLGGESSDVFAIDPVTGEITLEDDASLDRETNAELQYEIQVSDGETAILETVTVLLDGLNDSEPRIISSGPFAIDENSPAGTVIGMVEAEDIDEDPPQTLTFFEEPGGAGQGVFSIVESTGEIRVQLGADLDRETNEALEYDIIVSDGTLETRVTVVIELNGVKDIAPEFNAIGPFVIDENSPADTAVGTVTATDADVDPRDTLSFFEVEDGEGSNEFEIDPDTGAITVQDGAGLDREAADSVGYEIFVTDGVNETAATVTVELGGVNDNGPVAVDQNISADQNTPLTITLTGTDLDTDPSEALVFTITSDPSDGDLSEVTQLTDTTAEVTYTPNTGFIGTDTFTFTVSDGQSESVPRTVTIPVGQGGGGGSGSGGGGGGGGFIPPPTATPLPVASETVPGAPRDVAAVPDDGTVRITWQAPASDGGSPLTGYRIVNDVNASVYTAQADATSYVVEGLENGVPYSFQLQATNLVGPSERVSIGPVIPGSAPSAPTSVSVQLTARGDTVVTWGAPASDGGSDVVQYVIAFSGGDDITTVSATGALRAVITGLTPGESYAFDVFAVNAIGRSEEPGVSETVTIPGVSSAPGDPAVTPAPGVSEHRTEIVQGTETRGAVDSAAGETFGAGVVGKQSPLLFISIGQQMSIIIELDGEAPGTARWDRFDIDSEQLSLRTGPDGRASFTLALNGNVSIIGAGSMSAESGMARLSVSQSVLRFTPGPGAGALTGVTFIVDLLDLPEGASLEAVISTVISDSISDFEFTVPGMGGPAIVLNPQDDVAGSVSVEKVNFENSDFGETTVSFGISSEWHGRMVALEQAPVFVKVGDDGELFYEPAVCAIDGDGYICRAVFSGDAAGFSDFALVGVTEIPEVATPTLTPQPTSTPAPTPSPAPTTTPVEPDGSPTPTVEPSPSATPLPEPTQGPLVLPSSNSGGGIPFWAWIVGAVLLAAVGRVGWYGYSRLRTN